jgi:hypothetical protein
MSKRTRPRQAASARALDRYQQEIRRLIRKLAALLRAMERAERR